MDRNTAQRLGSWKITAALLALVGVAGIVDFHGWYYWAALGVYTAHIAYAYAVSRSIPFAGRSRPSWRRTDSRKADGDRRGPTADERG